VRPVTVYRLCARGALPHDRVSNAIRLRVDAVEDFIRRESPVNSSADGRQSAHEVDNLYVVDGSFVRSGAAVNLALTIIANALRVGEYLRARLSEARRLRGPLPGAGVLPR